MDLRILKRGHPSSPLVEKTDGINYFSRRIMNKRKNCSTRRLTGLFFLIFGLMGVGAVAQPSLPILKSDQKPALGWSVLQSDTSQIRLGYKSYSSLSSLSEATIYLGLFPQGTPKASLSDGVYLSYDTVGGYQGRVSADSVQSLNYSEPLVRLEPLGWIRDWRIGRLIVRTSRSYLGQTYRISSTLIQVLPSDPSRLEIDTTVQAGDSRGNGLDKVLGDMLVNYQPDSPLRALPLISRGYYPGLTSPDFLDKKKSWVRFEVSTSGLCRIPLSDLSPMGLNIKKGLPQFKLYRKGLLQPLDIIEPDPDVNGDAGSLIFFNQNENNPYSSTQAYWLSWDDNFPLTESYLAESLKTPEDLGTLVLPKGFFQKTNLFFEEDNIQDFTVSMRGFEVKEPWFWKSFSVTSSGMVKIELKGTDNLEASGGTIPLEIVLAGKPAESKVSSHLVVLTWDSQTIGKAQWSGANLYSFKTSFSPSSLKSGFHKLGISLTGTKPSSPQDEIYLDSVRFDVRQPLQYEGFPLEIIPAKIEPSVSNYLAVTGIDSSAMKRVLHLYAVDTQGNLKKVSYVCREAEKTLLFPVSPGVKSYYLGSLEDGMETLDGKPYKVKDDLRSTSNQADYILIYHPDFLEAAQTLAKYRAKQGLAVRLVNVMDIYDQFNYGDFNPETLRDFLKYTLYFWKQPYPAYVLLMGDGTSDYKGRNQNGVINYIPPYRTKVMTDEDASDLWYVQLTGNDAFPDMEIGRISVNNPIDADAVVGKTIQYESSPERGLWRNRILFVADDGFEQDCWDMAELLPSRFFRKFINLRHYPYVDNFYLPPGEDSKISPDANKAIMDAISEGDLSIIYFGHGSPNVWGHERMLFGGDSKNSDMKKLTNGRKLPLVFNLTCSMGQFDWPTRPWNICITEDMHRVPDGGAVSLYEPTGKGFTPQHKQLTQRMIQALFTNEQWVHGDAVTESVISYFLDPTQENLPQMYVLFSDPALRMLPPDKEIALETTPRLLVNQQSTTLHISSGSLPFKEGTLYLEIGEKKQEYDIELAPEEQGCFSGQTSFILPFKNGQFSFEFPIRPLGSPGVIPIRIYGIDKKGKMDASGYSLLTVDSYRLNGQIFDSTVDQGTATLWAEIMNPGPLSLPGIVGIFKMDGNPVTQAQIGSFAAGQSAQPMFQFPVPPGVHTLEVEAKTLNGYSLLTITRMLLNPDVPPSYPSLSMTDGEIRMDPEIPVQGKNLEIQAVIHNLDRVSQDSVRVELVTNGKQVVSFQNIASIPAQSAFTTTMKWTISRGIDTAQLALVLSGETAWSRLMTPLQMSDPSISSTDVIMSKEGYLDGETLFATITVHNYGDLPAEDVQVIAYDGDPNVGTGKQLMDRTDWRIPTIPSIAPHSYRVIRQRMDTLNNAGDRNLYFIVNRFNRTPEWDANNNKAKIPVHIYSKPQLSIVKTEWLKDTTLNLPAHSRKVLLRATITNKGETTAEDVVVQFYNHNVKIGGDLVIPSIKHKEEKSVESYWDIPLGKHNVHVEVGLKSHFDRASNTVLGLDGN